VIYFMQPADGGPVNIGYSVDVGTRRMQLSAAYSRGLVILATMEGGRAEEREIHARFAHLRFGRTEQFQPAPELLEFIGRPLFANATPVVPMDSKEITLASLKGSPAQADWLEAAHKKTHFAKSVIVRLALALWAERNGLPPFPSSEDDQ
jgi:hypothetical protein